MHLPEKNLWQTLIYINISDVELDLLGEELHHCVPSTHGHDVCVPEEDDLRKIDPNTNDKYVTK